MNHLKNIVLKRKALLLLPLLLLGSKGMAQIGESRCDLAVGVNGGVTLDKIQFVPTIKQNFKLGKTFGASVRYTCEKYFKMICALQAEVNYTELGWQELIETSSDTYERTISYVQIPLLARLGFGREERGLQGYILLGPQLGFYLSDNEKRSGEFSTSTLLLRPNGVTQQYRLPIQNSFDYGITGGAGLEFSTSVGHFMLDARYNFSLSDIFHNTKQDPFGRSAHGAITAKLTYFFDIIKTKGAIRK